MFGNEGRGNFIIFAFVFLISFTVPPSLMALMINSDFVFIAFDFVSKTMGVNSFNLPCDPRYLLYTLHKVGYSFQEGYNFVEIIHIRPRLLCRQ